ncbi:MAG: head GIN domain-containing protein [Dehalococcoidia bacterium]
MSGWKIALIVLLTVVAVLALIVVLPWTPMGFSIGPMVIGSGQVIADELPYEEFSRVKVSNAIEVEITRADDYTVTVTGYENLLQRMDVELTGQELTIRLEPGTYFRNNIRAIVTMPNLSGLTVSGASRANATGFTSSADFDLEVSGASRVSIDLEAGNTIADISGASRLTGTLQAQHLTLIVSGASNCQLTGTAGDMDLDVSGASDVKLLELPVQNVDAGISGASRVTINMDGTLNVDLSGASRLQYTGDVDLGTVNVSGASTMNRL